MKVNPFTFGNPISDPSRFFGRKEEIHQIAGRLLSPAFESTSVVGERRIGKTSLLEHLANPVVAEELGLSPDRYATAYVDFQGCADITPVRFWGRVLRNVARTLSDKELAQVAKETMAKDAIDQYDLEDLFMEIEDRDLHLVLLIDEFEYITQNPNFGVDFFSGLRALAIHCPLALITASREGLYDLCHSEEVKSSPFFNIFANVVLKPFSADEAESLIQGSLESTGVGFTDSDIRHVMEIAGGHPIFLQMASHYCFEGRVKGLEAEPLHSYTAEGFLEQAEPHFAYLWTKGGESERIALLALLALTKGKKPPTRERLVASYARADYILKDLARRGLVREEGENCTFFSPLFADWLLHEISAAAGEEEDERTADEWLSEQGGITIETGATDSIKRGFSKLKRKYWPLIGDFMTNASAEVAAGLILRIASM
jgi:hypothetical protein